MKLTKLYTPQQPRLMIIPMIDIIFFLLVLFMMSTLYMIEQNVLPVSLPQTTTAQPDQSISIPITLTAQKKILINQEELPREYLAARVKSELSNNREAFVVLRADKQLDYGFVVEILDELKASGVQRISVATDIKKR